MKMSVRKQRDTYRSTVEVVLSTQDMLDLLRYGHIERTNVGQIRHKLILKEEDE